MKEKVRWLPESFYEATETKLKSGKKAKTILNENSLISSPRPRSKNIFSKNSNFSPGKSFGVKSSHREKYFNSVRSFNKSKESKAHFSVSVINTLSVFNDERFEKYNSLNIRDNLFKSISEFFDELKFLEKKNIELIHKRNDVMERCDKIKKKIFISQGDEETLLHATNEIALKEKFLLELKIQNQNFKEKIQNLSQLDENKNIISKSTPMKCEQENKIFRIHLKIYEIFDFCNSNLTFSKINQNLYKLYTSRNEERILSMLTEIEKAINFLCDKYSFYRSSNTYMKKLKILENEIEKQRKLKKTKEQVLLQEQRIAKLKHKIISKNKIFVISRKTGMRIDPFKNSKRMSQQLVSKVENEFEQLISF